MNHLTNRRLPLFIMPFAMGFVIIPQREAASVAFVPRPPETKRPHTTAHARADIDIPIIFENDRLLAVVKPQGISHHDDPSAGELGILSRIRQQQQQPDPSFSYPQRLYGVHRLDRVTSGILLFAKDSVTAGLLGEMFRNKEITKFYMAVSGKRPTKKKQGWVKGMMTVGRRGSYKLVNHSKEPKGGEEEVKANDDELKSNKKHIGFAATRFYSAGLGNLPLSTALGNDLEHDEGDGWILPKTAILFRPHTGKTHQLRVAAKSVSMPILGDDRYGGGRLETSPKEGVDGDVVQDWNRTYLHASAMYFQLGKDENVTIWSPPPFDHLFSTTGLNDVFVGMMEKYCDCTPILDAMHEAATN